jgi:hypothetical protein
MMRPVINPPTAPCNSCLGERMSSANAMMTPLTVPATRNDMKNGMLFLLWHLASREARPHDFELAGDVGGGFLRQKAHRPLQALFRAR